METKARFLQFTDKVVLDDETKNPYQGGMIKDGTIFRFLDGKLHAEGEPAIETEDGHHEWWKDGKLHREGGPAVYSIYEGDGYYEEFWETGTQKEKVQ